MTVRQIFLDEEIATRLVALDRLCFSDRAASWSEAEYIDLAATEGGIILADPDAAAGFLLMRIAADEAEILSLGVAPHARRQRLGASLVGSAIAIARLRGVARMFLEVAADNAPALALYDEAAFTPVGRRQAYYRRPDGARADALIMERAMDGMLGFSQAN
ncbi:MAG: GNAT family N-acetyltransferase [Pseudomonadota bacterium]